MDKVSTNTRFMGYGLLLVIAFLVLAVVLTNQVSLSGLGTRSHSPLSRISKNIPIVENYYSRNWDYRARNSNDQVLVLGRTGEPLEKFLFRISCALALCAHMGFAPPIVVVQESRITDCIAVAKDVPELIQDIFPKLRVLSVGDPYTFARTNFREAMFVRGSIARDCSDEFIEFPNLTSPTVVLTGDWESWKYTEDYRTSIFEHLDFHPSIYHYVRKTYPQLFDRKSPCRGIVLGGVGDTTEEEVKIFMERNNAVKKLIVFVNDEVSNPEMFGESALVVNGESSHIIIYASAFFKDLLIDSSLTGWWAGMHSYYRGKNVYYTSSDESEHFMSPHWIPNKSG